MSDGILCRESNGYGLEPSYCHFYVGHHGKHSFEIKNAINKPEPELREEIEHILAIYGKMVKVL